MAGAASGPGHPAAAAAKPGGRCEEVSTEAIEERLRGFCDGLDPDWVRPKDVAQKIAEGLFEDVGSAALEAHAAETCAYLAQRHPDFSLLAARLAIARLHRETLASFSETCRVLVSNRDSSGTPAPLVSEELWHFVRDNAAALDAAVDCRRDFSYDFFALRTLERSYLLRAGGQVVERPQHMLMRVACGIHTGDLPLVLESYDLMSRRFFTHASPTLFHAGTPRPQLSSCYLVTPANSSIDAVFRALRQCAVIADSAGGLGICFSDVPAAVRGLHGCRTQGLIPTLRVFNETARLVDAGGGRRPGALAAYIEPWHADVLSFLELRKNHGPDDRRARDLFYGLWVPDLFMRRVEADEDWSLFCPREARDPDTGHLLSDLWGEAFDALYKRLEAQGRARQTMRARQLWFRILDAQVETGMPYMLYKDAINRKSNQQSLGTIRCSNLCTEIVQFSSADEVAVCNLASISLPAFVREQEGSELGFDFGQFHRVVKVVVRNLDRVIDRNAYPVEEARRSNLRHRPLGLGVQGLADVFQRLRMPFDSVAARRLNEEIFEALYFSACDASCELAEAAGPYPSYGGSPASRGQLQFDLWGVTPRSGRWDWDELKARIAQHGMRNSQLIAPMPTASTAQLLGNSESFEPLTQNLYVRRVLSGEFVQLNRRLVEDLAALGLWTEDLRRRLVLANGSVQSLEEVPEELKALYKTAWEIKQRAVVDMAADRGPYVDQSQSLSIFMDTPTLPKLTSMHFYGWKRGLKTGMYYLRTRAAVDAVKVTVEPTQTAQKHTDGARGGRCLASSSHGQVCESCSG